MADLIIDKEAFLRRIRKLYSFWKVNVWTLIHYDLTLRERQECKKLVRDAKKQEMDDSSGERNSWQFSDCQDPDNVSITK